MNTQRRPALVTNSDLSKKQRGWAWSSLSEIALIFGRTNKRSNKSQRASGDSPRNDPNDPALSSLPPSARASRHSLALGQTSKALKALLSCFSSSSKPSTTMPFDQDPDLSWKKPDWTTNAKLRPTGKSASGNLAKPITNLPHQKAEGETNFQKPEYIDSVPEKTANLGDKSLAKPITALAHGACSDPNLAFEKPEWTKDSGLNNTGKGDKLKTGQDISRPIGGIRPVED